MSSKIFSHRFNRELSLLGFPEELSDKIKAISKVFDVTRHLANGMIFGQLMPSPDQLRRISEVLEVCPQWLSGVTDKKKAYAAVRETSEESE